MVTTTGTLAPIALPSASAGRVRSPRSFTPSDIGIARSLVTAGLGVLLGPGLPARRGRRGALERAHARGGWSAGAAWAGAAVSAVAVSIAASAGALTSRMSGRRAMVPPLEACVGRNERQPDRLPDVTRVTWLVGRAQRSKSEPPSPISASVLGWWVSPEEAGFGFSSESLSSESSAPRTRRPRTRRPSGSSTRSLSLGCVGLGVGRGAAVGVLGLDVAQGGQRLVIGRLRVRRRGGRPPRARCRARRRCRRRPGCGRRRRRWWSRRPASSSGGVRVLVGGLLGGGLGLGGGADSSGSAMSKREPPSGISVPGVEVAPPAAGASSVSVSALVSVSASVSPSGVTSASASSWLRSTSASVVESPAGVLVGVLVGRLLGGGLGLGGGCGLLGFGDVEEGAALGDLGAGGGGRAA